MTEPVGIEERIRHTLDTVAQLPPGALDPGPAPVRKRRIGRTAEIGRTTQIGSVLVAAGAAAALTVALTVPGRSTPTPRVRIEARPASPAPTPPPAEHAPLASTPPPSAVPSPAEPPGTEHIRLAPPAFGPASSTPLNQPPTRTDVVDGKWVSPAELDNGAFEVSPFAGGHPAINAKKAAVLFGSDSSVAGGSSTAPIFGFGLVSLQPGLGARLHRTPAWVGVVRRTAYLCPMEPVSVTTTPDRLPTPGYTAVIIVGTHKVFDYQSRTSICDEPATGPSVEPASETISVPWRLVSLAGGTVTYRYRVPSCDRQSPNISIRGNANTGQDSLTLLLTLPFDRPSCPQTWVTGSTRIGPPPGPGAPTTGPVATITHGPTGPVGRSEAQSPAQPTTTVTVG